MTHLHTETSHRRRRLRAPAAGVCCALLLGAMLGCRSTIDATALREPLDEERMIGGIQGPAERELRAAEWERRRRQLVEGGVSPEGLEELDAAQALFDAGEYRAAESAFKGLARRRERAGKDWRTSLETFFSAETATDDSLFGQYGDPIHEDALFMTAESQFAQGRYPWAQDGYAALLEKYPATRHMNEVTHRLFYIARYWLGVPQEAGTNNEIQLVSHEADGAAAPSVEELDGPAGWALLPNLTDRSQPVFDREGRALQALETIWQHDVTGPLADDALMLQATYAQRKGDYVEAARLYALIREEYSDSPHLQDAFVLGSHVELASYSGPGYDGKTLAEARDLKRMASTFPTLTPEQRARLERELEAIEEAEVEREWERVQFYLRKNQPASVAVYCNRILNLYPESEYARRAWDVLQEQEAEFRGSSGGGFWPFGRDDGDEQPRSVPPTVAAGPPIPTEVPPDDESSDDEPERGGPLRFLRPVERPPALAPVEEGTPAEFEEPARVQL